jgi:dephospho-CoA kinase
MILLGLTGGIGMGKSACEELLRQRGVSIIDTDRLARQLVEPGQPALAEIKGLCGPEIIGNDGRLRRGELARRVFSDTSTRTQLESILHPRIRSAWKAQVDDWKKESLKLAVVVIPLLFETGAENEFNAVICVASSAATQQLRLLARGWSPDHIAQRMNAQLSIESKMSKSNFVIWTEASLEIHAAQLDRILARVAGSS